jgi:integrase
VTLHHQPSLAGRACPLSEAGKERRPSDREHLTPGEVETLIEAARGNRYGHRDATMILLTYRHGLRAAEVCDLRWDEVDFAGDPLGGVRAWTTRGSAATR